MPHFRQFNSIRQIVALYKFYPYCMKHEGTQTRPSLKGNKMNDSHRLSMTWRQFHEIAKIYLKYLGLYLMSGNDVALPAGMGSIRLYKYRYKEAKRVDFNHYNKTGEWKFFQNNHTGGYIPLLRWHRDKAKFKHKDHWSTRFVKTYGKKLGQAILKDPSLLLSYSNAPTRARPITVRNTK